MYSDTTALPTGREFVRRVSWGAILAGTVVAMALMVFFTVLGIAIGASAVDLSQSDGAGGFGTGSAIYTIVTQILSLIAGGYTAARLAGVPRTTTSVLHGAAVWSVTTLLLAWLTVTGAGAVFNTASSVLNATTRGVANMAQTVIPDDVSFPDLSNLAGQISIEDLPEPLQETLEENDITVEDLQTDVRETVAAIFSAEERDEAVSILQSAFTDSIQSPGNIGAELNAALDDLVGGPNAVLSTEDRREALAELEERLGITPQEAEQVFAAVSVRVEEAIAGLRESIDNVQQQAVEAAETAASTVSTMAWWLSLASLLGFAAATGGAILGKPDGLLGDRLDDHTA